jgi:hypothetical protein
VSILIPLLRMESRGQSAWSPASPPCGATSRSHDHTFLHGQRPWSPAAGKKNNLSGTATPWSSA